MEFSLIKSYHPPQRCVLSFTVLLIVYVFDGRIILKYAFHTVIVKTPKQKPTSIVYAIQCSEECSALCSGKTKAPLHKHMVQLRVTWIGQGPFTGYFLRHLNPHSHLSFLDLNRSCNR